MQFQVAFKQMESSEALKAYAESKIQNRVSKLINKPVLVNVTFSVDRKDHIAHCGISGIQGADIQVQQKDENMYAAVDRLADKLEAQLKKHKEKMIRHKGKKSQLTLHEMVEAEDEELIQ